MFINSNIKIIYSTFNTKNRKVITKFYLINKTLKTNKNYQIVKINSINQQEGDLINFVTIIPLILVTLLPEKKAIFLIFNPIAITSLME